MIPVIHAGAVTCLNCGHDWHQHQSTPPYTGAEWCEGAGYGSDGHHATRGPSLAAGSVRCTCGRVFFGGNLLTPMEDYDQHHMTLEYPVCLCKEFEPVDMQAFEAYQVEWESMNRGVPLGGRG